MIDLAEVFKSSEKVNLEVKAAQGGVPNSIWETYSSFANTFGGTIILGISENKETGKFVPVGVSDSKKMISDIWNVLNNRQKISANILLEDMVYSREYEGRDYIVIEVPRADRRDKPIFIGTDMFNGSFRRNHEGDYHCSKEEVRAMIRDQSDTSADSLVLDKVGTDALNNDSVKSYRSRFRNIREEHVWNKLPTDQFLLKIGAARISDVDGKIHPTLGGLIFFGNYIDITYELPNFFLDYRERLSNEKRWTDRVCSQDGDWSGNVFDFYYKIIDRLTSDVQRPFALDDKLTRIDDTPIHKALRECLANALIHADYYGRRGIVIDKEFRKITFSNPGIFRIDIDEAIAGGISDARNAIIFNMFSLINVGERSGIGLCDVFSTWKEYGYKEPELVESIAPDRITITLEIELCDRARGNVANGVANVGNNVANVGDDVANVGNDVANVGNDVANVGNDVANVGNDVANVGNDVANVGNDVANVGNDVANVGNDVANNRELSELEKSIFDFIASHTNASTKDIAEAVGVTARTVQRSIKELERCEIIKKAGKRNNIEWIILR